MSEGALPTPVTIEELLAQARWIRRLASQLVVGEEAADELAQAGLVQALTNPPRHGGNLRAWFAVVLRNLARHQGVAAKREREERATAMELGRAEQESSDQIVMRLETQQLVGEALLQLQPEHRDVLVLRFYDELSFREIGERLGVPQATARSRTERALEELRKRLDLLGGTTELDWRAGIALWIGASWKRGAPAPAASGSWATAVGVASVLAGALAVAWWAPWRGPVAPTDVSALTAPSGPTAPVTGSASATSGETSRTPIAGADTARVASGRPILFEGRVLHDATSEPLVGARVRVLFGGYWGAAYTLHTVTDEDGRFVLEGVPTLFTPDDGDLLAPLVDHYVLRVEHDGPLASYERRTLLVDLALWREGDDPVAHRIPDLRLPPVSQPTGTLLGDWAERGEIWLSAPPHSARAIELLRKVGTWEGGARQVTWLDKLGARVHGELPASLIAWDGTRLAHVDYDLPPDGRAGRDLVFEAPPVGEVRIRLVTPDGTPIVGERVTATPLSWPLRSRFSIDYNLLTRAPRPTGWDDARRAVTDADGVALFPALSATDRSLVDPRGRPLPEGDGLFPAGTYVFCNPRGGAFPHRMTEPVLVRGGEVLERTLVIGGEPRSIVGTVHDSLGRPVASLEVRAQDALFTDRFIPAVNRAVVRSAVTDSLGRFRLDDVDEHGQGVERLWFLGEKRGLVTRDLIVELPATGVHRLGVVVLPEARTVTGWLVNEAGGGFPGSSVAIGVRPAGLDLLRPTGGPLSVVPVREDGAFEFHGLAPGPHALYPIGFEEAGLVPFEPYLFDSSRNEVEVVTRRYDEAGTQVVVGVAAQRGDGSVSIRDAVAYLEREGAPPLVFDGVIDPGSKRAGWKSLPRGEWWIGVGLHGGERHWRNIVLDGSQPSVRLDLALSPKGSLIGSMGEGARAASLDSGVVRARLIGPCTADGGPDVERELGAPWERATIESNGSFRFDALRPGRYELRLTEGAVVVRGVVEVASGVETRVSLDPRPARRLVLEGDASPYLHQRLRLALTLTGEDGERYAWPVEYTEDGAVARIPSSATTWEARWWVPVLGLGTLPAVPLPDVARGSLGPDSPATATGSLPR